MKNVGYIVVLLIFASGCATNSRNLSHALGEESAHSRDLITVEEIVFASEGVPLSGSIFIPKNPQAAVVLVHGSDPVPRMSKLAESLAKHNLLVLTYDKRGVGESGGVYVGPQVGTNNISVDNLTLLAKDASAAVDVVREYDNSLSIGLLGASQAGWIIPIAALNNQSVEFMVLFSSPTITTLEQLRFQFYTNGREDFWQTQSYKEAREHTLNDPDKYEFNATDPKVYLDSLSIPGLWLFGEQDIQVPVKMCVEQLNELKAQGKPFDYVLFPSLGHNTNKAEPLAIAIHWIEQKYASN